MIQHNQTTKYIHQHRKKIIHLHLHNKMNIHQHRKIHLHQNDQYTCSGYAICREQILFSLDRKWTSRKPNRKEKHESPGIAPISLFKVGDVGKYTPQQQHHCG